MFKPQEMTPGELKMLAEMMDDGMPRTPVKYFVLGQFVIIWGGKLKKSSREK